MRQTVVFKLQGSLSDAVAVEWTDVAAPLDSATGWQACASLGDGRWQLASSGEGTEHVLARGGHLAGIGLRYRLVPGGVWSPVSLDRKLLEIPEQSRIPPPFLAPVSLRWRARARSAQRSR